MVQHHLIDSYDFHIVGSVGFPLPVILFDNGLQIFSSSKFHHGESVVEQNGNFYKIHYDEDYNSSKIYKTDAAGTIHLDEAGHAE